MIPIDSLFYCRTDRWDYQPNSILPNRTPVDHNILIFQEIASRAGRTTPPLHVQTAPPHEQTLTDDLDNQPLNLFAEREASYVQEPVGRLAALQSMYTRSRLTRSGGFRIGRVIGIEGAWSGGGASADHIACRRRRRRSRHQTIQL